MDERVRVCDESVRWKKIKNAKVYSLYVRYSKHGKYKPAVKTKKLGYTFTVKKGSTIYAKVRGQNNNTSGKMSDVKVLKVK